MAEESPQERIGIIGVGRMGLAMSKHVLGAGYGLTVCDIDRGSLEKARALGAKPAASPAELGRRAGFIMIGVGYDEEVREVVLGPDGVLGTLPEGSVIAVSSTVAPQTVMELERLSGEKGVAVLDTPICRGRWFADAGKLLALFGGRPEVIERARPIYSTFCSDIACLGDVGHGQVGKAINNLLLWVSSIGLIEAGRIADARRAMKAAPLRDSAPEGR